MRPSRVLDVLFWAGVTLAYGACLLVRGPFDLVPLVAVGTLVVLVAGIALVSRDARFERAGTRWRVLAGSLILSVAYATAAPARGAVVVLRFRMQRAQLASVARAAIAHPSSGAVGTGTRYDAAAPNDDTGIATGLQQTGYLDVTVWPEYVVFAESGFLSMQRGVLWVRPGHHAPPLGPSDDTYRPDHHAPPLGPSDDAYRPSFYGLRALGDGWYVYKAL